jgi:uncharacterized repeat protein (TIGR02543 family)
MTMKRFLGGGRALFPALCALGLLGLIRCANPGGNSAETPSLVSISAETSKTVYLRGESLNLDAITVTGTYSDGNTKIIPVSDVVIAGYNAAQVGDQRLTVTVEGKSAEFTVTVTDNPATAKETLNAAIQEALDDITTIAVSEDGSDVPQGVKWVSPEQKAALDEALAAARELAASEEAEVDDILAALDSLERAAEELAALAEQQTGAETDWSYTVAFDANGGEGELETKTVAYPETTVGSLPADPTRSGYVFSGWNTAADGSGGGFVGTTPVAADLTVYAQWAVLVNARAPVISAHPQDGAYAVGADAAALTVAAESPDDGELSYQWHSSIGDGWTAIDGATGASYTPPTAEAGAVAYYVKVTNTNNSVNGTKTAMANSSPATITATGVNAQAPVISAHPQSASYTVGAAAAALTVAAESPDGGELSYQWNSGAGSGDAGGALSDATGASYTPPTAEAGTLYYYVRVANTNNGANGTKTATANSEAAAIAVTVNAQAPVISVHPQSASYAKGAAAAALTVAAASPDGGTLSYQWFSSTGNEWTPIEGANESSYMPSTAAAGAAAYYVRVANANNSVNGTKTAVTNSNTATVMVTSIGTGSFVFAIWANNDNSLISDMPEYLDISRSLGERLTIAAADDLTDLQWAINSINLEAPRGSAQSIVIEAATYPIGNYTLRLYAKKNGVPYSINITFVVDN